MWGRSKQASSATMALVYITVGALTDVWTVIYYLYLNRHGGSDTSYLWCYGFFFSGLVVMFIGFLVGRIGRSAKQAETAATPAQVVVPPVAGAAAGMPGAFPTGQPAAPGAGMPAPTPNMPMAAASVPAVPPPAAPVVRNH